MISYLREFASPGSRAVMLLTAVLLNKKLFVKTRNSLALSRGLLTAVIAFTE
jgi:hypothetical protein